MAKARLPLSSCGSGNEGRPPFPRKDFKPTWCSSHSARHICWDSTWQTLVTLCLDSRNPPLFFYFENYCPRTIPLLPLGRMDRSIHNQFFNHRLPYCPSLAPASLMACENSTSTLGSSRFPTWRRCCTYTGTQLIGKKRKTAGSSSWGKMLLSTVLNRVLKYWIAASTQRQTVWSVGPHSYY